MKSRLVITAFALLCVNSIFGKDIEVTFQSGDATLSATLLLPSGPGPFPAFVFIHGSGPEDRNGSKYRAKAFVKNGFAAFIYDKRGVGKSGGDPKFSERYSFEQLAADVVAAAEFLSTRPEIDKARIGFFAASQGGWVAPLAATKFQVAFMIIVSGSVTTLGEDNIFERGARLRKEGFSEKDIQEAMEMHMVDLQVTRDGSRYAEFESLWTRNVSAPWFKRVYLDAKPSPINSPYRQWYRTVVDVGPVPYLTQISTPVLWLYGDAKLDHFCPVEKSLEALKNLGNKPYTVRVSEGADHSLQKGSKDLSIDDSVFIWLKGIRMP